MSNIVQLQFLTLFCTVSYQIYFLSCSSFCCDLDLLSSEGDGGVKERAGADN